jgi:hypothetical protein
MSSCSIGHHIKIRFQINIRIQIEQTNIPIEMLLFVSGSKGYMCSMP